MRTRSGGGTKRPRPAYGSPAKGSRKGSEISASPSPRYWASDDATFDSHHNHAPRTSGGTSPAKAPLSTLPPEIITSILRHLSRKDHQALRCVNRQLCFLISPSYFETVLCQFHPNLYMTVDANGQAQGTSSRNILGVPHLSQSLRLVDGMRIFRDFSRDIKSFGLSLEIDEAELAWPPQKFSQEIIFSPHLVYRWPKAEAPRYVNLQQTEELAGDLEMLKEAMFSLRSVHELGLSCDGGLGYLRGEDISPDCPRRLNPVLRNSKFEPDLAQTLAEAESKNCRPVVQGKTREYSTMFNMMKEANVPKDEIHEAIKTLLACEGRTLGNEDSSPDNIEILPSDPSYRPAIKLLESEEDDGEPAIAALEDEREFLIDRERAHFREHHEDRDIIEPFRPRMHAQLASSRTQVVSSLSAGQAEMLLELGWAQRALIQSYVLVLGDGLRTNVFSNLRLLNIARIPAIHVHHLNDSELWASMETVRTFSLGVIADWQNAERDDFGRLIVTKTQPSASCATVFTLLNGPVAETQNITEIHFEWICGGELAHGISQRERYVLPAPLTSEPYLMSRRGGIPNNKQNMIWLPHVQKLSLKNCWLSPHGLLQITTKLSRYGSLRHLELESVSLTGRPTLNNLPSIFFRSVVRWWQWPFCLDIAPDEKNAVPIRRILDSALLANSNAPPTNVNLERYSTSNLPPHVPQVFSWSDVINQLTPGRKLQEIASNAFPESLVREQAVEWAKWTNDIEELAKSQVDKQDASQVMLQKHSAAQKAHSPCAHGEFAHLDSIAFKSCGYVLVNRQEIDNWALMPWIITPDDARNNIPTRARLVELSARMLVPSDQQLGTVIPHIGFHEARILESHFGMRQGWEGVYPPSVIAGARADGKASPGAGRFTGKIVSSSGDLADE